MKLSYKITEDYKNAFLQNRKAILIFFILTLISTLSTFNMANYLHPEMEIIIFILVMILGIFCILYYKIHNTELHKVAFVVILCFGLVFAFLSPMLIIPDEFEHFTHSEITSRGELFPEYVTASKEVPSWDGNHFQGYRTIGSVLDFAWNDGNTVFNVDFDNKPINESYILYTSSFAYNPPYGYFAQAFGVFLAKLFDLNAIWLLWLGRAFNLVLYASLIALSVKKAPVLKVPIMAIACLPIIVMQGASMSIDSMSNGLGFLIFSFFLSMLKSGENSVGLKDIAIFTLLTILIALCRTPYLAFIFLLLFIPIKNYKTKFYYLFLFIICASAVCLLWSQLYSVPTYYNSFRIDHALKSNINMTNQISFMTTHLPETMFTLIQIPKSIGIHFNSLFIYSFHPYEYTSEFLNLICPILLCGIIFLYPYKNDFKIKTRVLTFLILALIYYGINIIQFLTWTPVGDFKEILGVSVRYFIPLMPFLPFVFNLNNNESSAKIDDLIIIAAIFILASVCALTAVKYY